jgi:hypothetical protein
MPGRSPGVIDSRDGRHLLSSHRSALAPDQERILELQRLAGNAAVADAVRSIGSTRNGRVILGVSRVTAKTNPMPPPKGVVDIRKKSRSPLTLGYTTRGIEEVQIPLFRAEAPAKAEKGWTTRTKPPRSIPEPEFEEWWPTTGRHQLAEHWFLDVNKDWEDKVHEGEDEHVRDSTRAWEVTWKKVAETLEALSKEPGPPATTDEAAQRAIWKRFVKALPAPLRPEGDLPTLEAQRAKWAPTPSTTFFSRLFEATRWRDRDGWHSTGTKPVDIGGKDQIGEVDKGTSNIGDVTSVKFIDDAWKKLEKEKS